MKHTCTRCQSSKTQIKREASILLYKGAELPCEEVFTVCNSCGHEFVTAEQSKEWDKLADVAKRHHDNLLSPAEIKRVRIKLKLSQKDAAQVFGGGTNAFSKYERGEVRQSVAMDKLLRVVQKHPELIHELSAN